MEEAYEVCDFLFPADQQSPRAIDPRVCPFHFPAAGLAMTAFRLRIVIVFGREMRYVMTVADFVFDRLASIPFIKTKVLWRARSGLRAFDGNTIERLLHKLLVMHIGAIHRRPKRDAAAVDQHGALDTQLAAIGRVFPGFFPHPAATCSSPRPDSAISSRSLSGHRILPRRGATTPQTRPASPTPESRRGSRCPNQTVWALPSTDIRFARRTKFRSRPSADTTADARLYDFVCKPGESNQCVPTKHRESGETLT